jgi:two-component system phosphate regulon sensor histidine kinase PhoR
MIWSSRLFWKVVATSICFIAFFSFVLMSLIARRQRGDLYEQLVERLHVSAILLRSAVEPLLADQHQEPLQELVRRLGRDTRTRLTVVATSGVVLADSGVPDMASVSAMDNHHDREEILEAMASGAGNSERISPTLDTTYYYYAVRIDGASGPMGTARASLPSDSVENHVAEVRRIIVLCALSAGCLSGLSSYFLVRRLQTQITRLAEAADMIASGSGRPHISIRSRDEVGHLAASIQRMSDEIDVRIHELRSRNNQLSAVLGGMIEGVIAIDGSTRIVFANDAAARMLGFSAENARGRSLIEAVRDELLHRSVKQSMNAGEVVTIEIKTLGKTKSTLATSVTPLPGTPCPGVVVVMHDVTELRRLESLRQEFVANVSHELKTPLSSIKAYAETLLDGAIHDPEHNLVFVGRIQEQADRLQQLIMDVISLARIESGQQAFEVADVSLEEAVKNSLSRHRAAAESKQITLSTSAQNGPIHVRADEEALMQILDNLVDNAIKYTTSGGTVMVKCLRDGQSAILEVTDTGIGISESDQPRVFERFYRVDRARSRELGGTGLGLSIVKHLVQFFGGSVGVHSQLGKGSTFWVRLPTPATSPNGAYSRH